MDEGQLILTWPAQLRRGIAFHFRPSSSSMSSGSLSVSERHKTSQCIAFADKKSCCTFQSFVPYFPNSSRLACPTSLH
jgi:hypothetical protein